MKAETSESINTQSFLQLLRPILGFMLFDFGAVTEAIATIVDIERQAPGFISLPLNMFVVFGFTLLSSIGLQLFLVLYEFYFYKYCHDFNELGRKALTTKEIDETFKTVRKMLDYMDSFHNCFGVFLLVDLSLMFFYWLLHLYDAYFTF